MSDPKPLAGEQTKKALPSLQQPKQAWRTGRKVPINVYEGDRPVCQCQTALDAALIVVAVNAFLRKGSS